MVNRSVFILSCLLFTSVSYGANSRKLTRTQSKEISSKASRILVNEEHPILEKALGRSLIHYPVYNSTDLLQQREQTIDKLTRLEDHKEEDLKTELMQWAIKELAERNIHEVEQKRDEQRKKWIAAAIGFVTTIVSVAVPIIFSEECDCPSGG